MIVIVATLTEQPDGSVFVHIEGQGHATEKEIKTAELFRSKWDETVDEGASFSVCKPRFSTSSSE